MKELEDLKNKDFAFKCIEVLKQSGKIDKNLIMNLCNDEFCSREFNISFPILVEVPLLGEISKEYYADNADHRRYYPERIALDNKAYLLTNHWYGPNKSLPDNRTPFMNWVNAKII